MQSRVKTLQRIEEKLRLYRYCLGAKKKKLVAPDTWICYWMTFERRENDNQKKIKPGMF